MATSNTANRQGSGFVNLQKVIGANKSNQLGSAIQSGVGNRVGQIKQDLGKVQNQFQTGLQSNKIGTDQDKSFVDQSLTKAQTSPNDINDQDVSKFQSLLSGQYKGPTGLQNTGAVDAQAMELGQYGSNIGSAAGRTNLLQRYAGGNKYSQGQQRLDNLLLGQTAGSQLKDVRKQAMGLSGDVNQAKAMAAGQGQQARMEAAGFGKGITERLGVMDDPTTEADESKGIYGDFQKAIAKKAADYNQQQKDAYSLYEGLGSRPDDAYTETELQRLGLTEGTNLYDLNLGQYIPKAPSEQAAQRVASAEDYAKYQALNRLAGRDNTFLYDRNMAGTAEQVGGFDKNMFESDLGKKQAAVGEVQGRLAGLENELAYREQWSKQTLANSPEAMSAWQNGNVDQAAAILASQLMAQNGGQPPTVEQQAIINKMREDAGPIQQYRNQISGVRNELNAYNPNRRLAILQNQAKSPDQQYAMPVDPVLGGGKTVKNTGV